MHLITAVVKPHKLEDINTAVTAVGVSGLTVFQAQGYGRQGGHTETYRRAEYKVDFVPKVCLQVVASAEDVEAIVDAIRGAAQSGKIGDGKIWVTPVSRVVRIRTGQEGPEAI